MEDLKQILKELESIEDLLRYNDTASASLNLHLLIVEILDKVNNNV